MNLMYPVTNTLRRGYFTQEYKKVQKVKAIANLLAKARAKQVQDKERAKVLSMSVNKLKLIRDPDLELCKAVLIKNTLKRLQNEVRDEKMNKSVKRSYSLMSEVEKYADKKIKPVTNPLRGYFTEEYKKAQKAKARANLLVKAGAKQVQDKEKEKVLNMSVNKLKLIRDPDPVITKILKEMCTVPELIPPIPDPELKLLDPIPESKQTPELLKALEIGYKVLEIYEVYDFNENEKKIRLS